MNHPKTYSKLSKSREVNASWGACWAQVVQSEKEITLRLHKKLMLAGFTCIDGEVYTAPDSFSPEQLLEYLKP